MKEKAAQAFQHCMANNCDGCPWKSKQWEKMGRAACEGFDTNPVEVPHDLLKCIADLLKEKRSEASLIDDGEDYINVGGKAEITRRWKCGACRAVVCYYGTRPPIKFCPVCGTKFKEAEGA